jgi:hypothetical protein
MPHNKTMEDVYHLFGLFGHIHMMEYHTEHKDKLYLVRAGEVVIGPSMLPGKCQLLTLSVPFASWGEEGEIAGSSSLEGPLL